MINMLGKFGFMRASTAMLGAGPLIAFSSKLGAIRRHQPNAIQIDDFKRSYAGRVGEVVHWFKNFRAKSDEIAARIDEIKVPTLVFWGEFDVLFDVENSKNLDAALPYSKLHLLPEAGHLSWADQPEMFASMVSDWVEGGYQSVTKNATTEDTSAANDIERF